MRKPEVIVNALILKFVNRLYQLFKVYSIMALLGALAAVVIQIVLAEQVVLIAALMVVIFASTLVLLWAQRDRRSHELQDEIPPMLPESLMIVSLPSDIARLSYGKSLTQFLNKQSS